MTNRCFVVAEFLHLRASATPAHSIGKQCVGIVVEQTTPKRHRQATLCSDVRGLDEVAVDSRCPFLVYQPRERMQQGAMVYKCAVWASAMH